MYTDDVVLNSDRISYEPKYTQLSRRQHLIAEHSEIIFSQNGTNWNNGTQQLIILRLFRLWSEPSASSSFIKTSPHPVEQFIYGIVEI